MTVIQSSSIRGSSGSRIDDGTDLSNVISRGLVVRPVTTRVVGNSLTIVGDTSPITVPPDGGQVYVAISNPLGFTGVNITFEALIGSGTYTPIPMFDVVTRGSPATSTGVISNTEKWFVGWIAGGSSIGSFQARLTAITSGSPLVSVAINVGLPPPFNLAYQAGTWNITSTPATWSTSTLSNVSASASSVTLIAANSSRKEVTIVNESTYQLLIKKGSSASSSSYTYNLAGSPSGFPYAQITLSGYTGILTGIWPVASGTARVTEDT